MTTTAELPDGPSSPSESDRFSQLAESALVGIFEIDAQGMIRYVNELWRQIAGVDDPLPIPYQLLEQKIDSQDLPQIREAFLKAHAAQSDFDLSAQMLGTDGKVRHVRFQGSPLRGDDGEFRGFLGTVIDLTNMVEATVARDQSERRYRDLIATAPVGQAVYATDGELIEVNQAWADLLGYEPDEVVGSRAGSHVHPDDRPSVIHEGMRLLRGELDHLIQERRLLHKDGHPVWVSSSITVERDANGRALLFHSLVIDINDRRMAEESLRQSEAKYRKLIHEAPVPQMIAQVDGTLVEVNDAFVRLMRSDDDELRARDPLAIFGDENLAGQAQQISQLVSGELEYFESERRLLRPDGTWVWVIGGTSLIEDGEHRYLHTVMQDITERREIEEALRDSESRYRAVIESLHDGLIVHTADRVLAANASAARILGVDVSRLIAGRYLLDIDVFDLDLMLVPMMDRPSVRCLTTGQPCFDVIQGLLALDGEMRWCMTNAVPLFHEGADRPYAVALSFTDITERQHAMSALAESETRFRTLAESLPVGIYHAGTDGVIDYANPRWLEINGIEMAEIATTGARDLVHPDDRRHLSEDLARALAEHRPYHVQYRIRHRDAGVRWLTGRGSRTYDPESGEPTGIIGSIEDVTPLIEAQEQNARLAGIVESTSDLVGIVDWPTGMMVYLNQAARRLFGLVDRDITAVHHLELFTPEAIDTVVHSLESTLRRGEVWSGELAMRTADESTVLVWQTIVAERTPEGDILQLSAVGRDVTERRRFEEQLAWEATHDPHTRLPNRALLIDHIELALARSERDRQLVAVLFLDLDRFKQVNDTLGHDAGDELLAGAAQRISDVLRPSDTVARIGGDEFVVLADDIEDEDHAMAIGHRISSAIDHDPFSIRDQSFDVTVSIGIALARGGDAHPESLLRDADAAMYRAKDLGRNRIEIFDESMRQRAARRHEMADELATAIENDHITVYYQPCVDLTNGVVTGVEALARWDHPTRGILSPHEFIGLAEDTGLIVGLGLSVMVKACHQGFAWMERFGLNECPTVHVNLSARQLTATNLPTLVEGVLQGTRLPAQKLCLEITESVLMDDAPSVIDTLWALKAIGVSIAIDDFGTGYSSLSYLRRFPVDVLKVDQSFVDGLGPDPEDSAIVAAIVNLAATLELDAIAEGVETIEQLERLRGLGCRGAQGFYFAEPRPPAEIEAFLTKPFTI